MKKKSQATEYKTQTRQPRKTRKENKNSPIKHHRNLFRINKDLQTKNHKIKWKKPQKLKNLKTNDTPKERSK